mmetsp:Transcript_1404/g.2710  ORF Transcript_1404/g.2710 Transcript_1404/m.2710 type:complete len:357 (+) Transcript_1404:70-1140(+)
MIRMIRANMIPFQALKQSTIASYEPVSKRHLSVAAIHISKQLHPRHQFQVESTTKKNNISIRETHSYLPSMGHGRGRMDPYHGISRRDPKFENILQRLKHLGAGPLCDADKSHRHLASTSDDPALKSYSGLSLMCPQTMKLRNHSREDSSVMVGIARTVQLSRPNDFLAVLYALSKARAGDVLVVNTSGSTRAVAGGLFATEAARRNLSGIVIDGPVRDVEDLGCAVKHDGTLVNVYSTSVNPYAGTVQFPGEGIDVAPVICGGATVSPGDIVFGDAYGVLVGSAEAFETCLHDAENISAMEQQLMKGIKMGVCLHSMMNFAEHLQLRKEGKASSLHFKDLNTVKFDGIDPVDLSA